MSARYTATTIADMEAEAERVIAATGAPRGTQELAPWREALRVEAARRKEAGDGL